MKKQTNRIKAIDFGRGMAVLFLAAVHTMWMYGTRETQTGWLGEVIHFIGKGTGMFLVTMGFSFAFSRRQGLQSSFKRALYLLSVGYGMNFLKFVFPALIGILPDDFIRAYGWTPPATAGNLLYMLSTGDILQLAGISMFLVGLVNHFSKNKYVPLILALLIVVFAKVVHGYRLGIGGVDYALDLLWGAGWNVYFALFPWAAFIFLGMFFGLWYKESDNDHRLIFKNMLLYGIVLMIIGGGLCLLDFGYHFGDFFHLGPGGALYLMGFGLVSLCLGDFILRRVPENKFFSFLYYVSRRVTSMYVIQWVIIMWGMGLLGYQRFGTVGVLLLIPMYTLLTFGIQRALDKLLGKEEKKNKLKVGKPVA